MRFFRRVMALALVCALLSLEALRAQVDSQVRWATQSTGSALVKPGGVLQTTDGCTLMLQTLGQGQARIFGENYEHSDACERIVLVKLNAVAQPVWTVKQTEGYIRDARLVGESQDGYLVFGIIPDYMQGVKLVGGEGNEHPIPRTGADRPVLILVDAETGRVKSAATFDLVETWAKEGNFQLQAALVPTARRDVLIVSAILRAPLTISGNTITPSGYNKVESKNVGRYPGSPVILLLSPNGDYLAHFQPEGAVSQVEEITLLHEAGGVVYGFGTVGTADMEWSENSDQRWASQELVLPQAQKAILRAELDLSDLSLRALNCHGTLDGELQFTGLVGGNPSMVVGDLSGHLALGSTIGEQVWSVPGQASALAVALDEGLNLVAGTSFPGFSRMLTVPNGAGNVALALGERYAHIAWKIDPTDSSRTFFDRLGQGLPVGLAPSSVDPDAYVVICQAKRQGNRSGEKYRIFDEDVYDLELQQDSGLFYYEILPVGTTFGVEIPALQPGEKLKISFRGETLLEGKEDEPLTLDQTKVLRPGRRYMVEHYFDHRSKTCSKIMAHAVVPAGSTESHELQKELSGENSQERPQFYRLVVNYHTRLEPIYEETTCTLSWKEPSPERGRIEVSDADGPITREEKVRSGRPLTIKVTPEDSYSIDRIVAPFAEDIQRTGTTDFLVRMASESVREADFFVEWLAHTECYELTVEPVEGATLALYYGQDSHQVLLSQPDGDISDHVAKGRMISPSIHTNLGYSQKNARILDDTNQEVTADLPVELNGPRTFRVEGMERCSHTLSWTETEGVDLILTDRSGQRLEQGTLFCGGDEVLLEVRPQPGFRMKPLTLPKDFDDPIEIIPERSYRLWLPDRTIEAGELLASVWPQETKRLTLLKGRPTCRLEVYHDLLTRRSPLEDRSLDLTPGETVTLKFEDPAPGFKMAGVWLVDPSGQNERIRVGGGCRGWCYEFSMPVYDCQLEVDLAERVTVQIPALEHVRMKLSWKEQSEQKILESSPSQSVSAEIFTFTQVKVELQPEGPNFEVVKVELEGEDLAKMDYKFEVRKPLQATDFSVEVRRIPVEITLMPVAHGVLLLTWVDDQHQEHEFRSASSERKCEIGRGLEVTVRVEPSEGWHYDPDELGIQIGSQSLDASGRFPVQEPTTISVVPLSIFQGGYTVSWTPPSPELGTITVDRTDREVSLTNGRRLKAETPLRITVKARDGFEIRGVTMPQEATRSQEDAHVYSLKLTRDIPATEIVADIVPREMTSVDESQGQALSLSPNPVVDFARIHGLDAPTPVEVHDPLGRLVLRCSVEADGLLDLRALRGGFYIVRARGQALRLLKR